MILWYRVAAPLTSTSFSLVVVVGVTEVSRGDSCRGSRLHVVSQVVRVLQEQVFEHTELFAEQLDLGLQSLVLLFQLVDTLLRVLRLLLAAHAALLHGQVVALAPLPVLIAVLVHDRLLHLAGWRGFATSSGAYWDELRNLNEGEDVEVLLLTCR